MAEPKEQLSQEGAQIAADAAAWLGLQNFAAENYQLLFFLPWIFGLVGVTEFLKPWIRELIKNQRRADLVVNSVPYIAGIATGAFFAPELGISKSAWWGATSGFGVGWVSTLAYAKHKDGTVGRWITFIAFTLVDALPFVQLSEENRRYLENRGLRDGEPEKSDLEQTMAALREHGTLLVDGDRIVLKLSSIDEESEVIVEQ